MTTLWVEKSYFKLIHFIPRRVARLGVESQSSLHEPDAAANASPNVAIGRQTQPVHQSIKG